MREYQCKTCGVNILLEPAEVLEHGAYCVEHLMSEEFPALNRLADQVSEDEKRTGSPAKSHRSANTETSTNQESSVMSDHTPNAKTFSPGEQTYIASGYTDPVDGEHYPGERLDLLSALVFGTEACEGIGTAQVYAITNDDGEQISAIKLTLVDEMRHSAEMTLEPSELQNIADWLQEQAHKVAGGEAA